MPRLPPEQAQARFTYLFREFVGAVATVEHPLAIFLDDLQWADLPSLTLISLLLEQPACRHVLVIGAYRDNEITPTHPLPGVLREATRRGVAMRTITLAPLGIEQVCRLLSDALHADNQRIDALARLCLANTQGNPFFLNQFLNVLVAQNMLFMDPVRQEWQWDMAGIEQADMTDNVVELMTGRLKQLSRPTLQVLLGAACLGNVFDLKTLALACAMPPGEAAQCLWPALEAGLVMPLDERYRYAQFVGQDDAAVAPKYRFLHDRVQRAALKALANELAGAFYLRSGQMAAAVSYLEQAHRGYLRWGALAKVSQLEECYPEVLAESRAARSAHPLPHIVIMSGSGTDSTRDYIGR